MPAPGALGTGRCGRGRRLPDLGTHALLAALFDATDHGLSGTVRATDNSSTARPGLIRWARFVTLAAALCLAFAAPLVATGCSGDGASKAPGSSEASAPAGANMAGPVQKVVISRSAVANRPKPWVLTTPESAVRSYLDWTSYAYRISESSAATRTMSTSQEVRVDSYVQLNLQKSRLLDQTLRSITFGKPVAGSESTLLPAEEHWSYRYVSISEVGKTIGGPYEASYETTYTVVKNDKGDWVVDTVAVKAIGEIK